MPCDSMRGWTPPPGMTPDQERFVAGLVQRVAELEQALCGLCQQLERPAPMQLGPMNPQLKEWFDKHKQQPGCEEFERLYGEKKQP